MPALEEEVKKLRKEVKDKNLRIKELEEEVHFALFPILS